MKRLLALGLAAAAGSAAALDEVPFITTPDHVTLAMLRLAEVHARDVVLDLGSGDGRIPITAARRFGARGIGVEIVPDLVAKSRENARRAGVADKVRFHEQDLFQTDLSVASVVTMYLLPDVNLQLRPKLLALAPGTRVVSHDWDLGDWRPDRTLTLPVPDKAVGKEKSSRLHLWTVPAPLDGLWCGRGVQVRIEQRFQQVAARVDGGNDAVTLDGRITGTWVQLAGSGEATEWRWSAGSPARLELRRAGPTLAKWQGQRFVPATGDRCPA